MKPVVIHIPEPTLFIPHCGFARPEPIDLPSFQFRPTSHVQELVALSYGLHPRIMTGKSKEHRHAWPRQVAMYLTRKTLHRSLPAIGRAFGDRHHTTVLYAIHKVQRVIASDPLKKADVEALRKALEG